MRFSSELAFQFYKTAIAIEHISIKSNKLDMEQLNKLALLQQSLQKYSDDSEYLINLFNSEGKSKNRGKS